jgi:hypothetical protein
LTVVGIGLPFWLIDHETGENRVDHVQVWLDSDLGIPELLQYEPVKESDRCAGERIGIDGGDEASLFLCARHQGGDLRQRLFDAPPNMPKHLIVV